MVHHLRKDYHIFFSGLFKQTKTDKHRDFKKQRRNESPQNNYIYNIRILSKRLDKEM